MLNSAQSIPEVNETWLQKRVTEIISSLVGNVYEKSQYKWLQEYETILWDNPILLWEWNFWVMVQSPDSWVALKVLKDSEHKKYFLKESSLQQDFSQVLEEWKKTWVIPAYFSIPKVLFEDTKYAWLSSIEKINWNSLLWIRNKKVYFEEIKEFLETNGLFDDEIEEAVNIMSDFQVSLILQHLWIDTIKIRKKLQYYHPLMSASMDDYIGWSPIKWWKSQKAQVGWWSEKSWLTISAEQLMQDIGIVNDYLESRWFYHKDLNAWNIMIWKNGQVYIIDFGTAEIIQQK
jgi:hypothetical protein